MLIKSDKSIYFLAESIPIKVTYGNKTADTLVIENPSGSFEVLMHLVDMKNNEDFKYTMGKIIVTVINRKTGEYVETLPKKEEIEISPNSSFKFTSDLNDRLVLHPGEFSCFLTDADNESNRIKITINFTQDSVEHLLKLAKNKEASYGRREWAMDWIRKIYPNFRLNLPLEDDHVDVAARKEKNNEIVFNNFTKWWQENRENIHLDKVK